MKKIFALVFSAAMLYSAAINAADATGKLEFLGNPFKDGGYSASDKNLYARSIWTMKEHGGKIILGAGDYHRNYGPVPVYSFDPRSKKFNREYTVDDEEILRMRILSDGDLYISGTDPKPWDVGFVYRRSKTGKWEKYGGFRHCIHMYDIGELADGTYFTCGVGVNMSGDKFVTKKLIFYKDEYHRVVDMMTFGNDAYFFARGANEVFKYNHAAETLDPVKHDLKRMQFGETTGFIGYFAGFAFTEKIPGDKYIYGVGLMEPHSRAAALLGVCDKNLKASKVKTPPDMRFCDVLTVNKTIYVLAYYDNTVSKALRRGKNPGAKKRGSAKEPPKRDDNLPALTVPAGDGWTACILAGDEKQITKELFSFHVDAPPKSFAYYENNFYIGLGAISMTEATEATGNLYRIPWQAK